MAAPPSSPKPKRPVGVTVIGIVAIAGGILSLFGGISVLAGMASGPIALAYIVLIFGFLGIGLGVGLLSGKPWARMATIIVYLISIGLGIAEILYGGMVGGFGGVIRIITGVIFPIYLMRQSSIAFFK